VKKLYLLGFVFISSILQAQPFGNEWINYSQKYYKFSIAEDGVYQITFNDLANAGIPISGIAPENMQLFAANKEVPIYIEGGEDGFFNSTDFIEFIGRKNDGSLDTPLYDTPNDQPNPFYSLYNDTLSYFLTWNTTGNNLRFEENDLSDLDSYTPREFIWKRLRRVYSNGYYQGQLDAIGISVPYYTKGEGWMSPRFGIPQGSSSITTEFNTSGVYQEEGAPSAEVFSVSAGVSNAASGSGNNHFLQIRYGDENALVVNFQFQGYEVNRFEFEMPNSSLGNESTSIRHEVSNSLGVASDYQALATLELNFPHSSDLVGANSFEFFYRLNTTQSKTRFDLLNVGGTTPRIYADGADPQRSEFVQDGISFQTLLENSFGDDSYDCLLATNETVRSVGTITSVANNGFFTNYGLAEVDSAFLIITHKSLLEAAQAYANYRQQRFNTVLTEVGEIYDQFGGGVENSGLALRNFSNFLINTWPTSPQYLLLLGKSVRGVPEAFSAGSRRDSTHYARNLVPTIGNPSADNLITAGLGSTILEPAIRTGRVSATNQEQLQWYLDKLQIFESQPQAAWMKNVLHFGGGRDSQEQNRFASYLFNYEQTIEDSAFGADVHTFLKTSSIPIEINLSEEVGILINGGCSMMTFFGHASSDGFDQTIDNPNNYEWNGKFPFLLGNGCYTGDYHGLGSGSTAEQYTILQEKGVIGFLSSTELGFETSLNDYSRKFYRYLSIENYGGTVGEHIRRTIQEIQDQNSPDNLFVINTTLGMSLQGDPAVVVNSWPEPDLSISAQDIFFTPSEITAETDSFTVNMVVTNIGRGTYQPFSVTLEHETPEGVGDSVYVRTLEGLLFKDTVKINLPVDVQSGLGLHRFNVLVDLPSNEVEELVGFESVNNQVFDRQLFISNGGVVPVYPYRFAVVDENPVELRASTGDPLAEAATYRIEVDTTDTFDSPGLLFTEITQTGGVLEWEPSLNYSDSLVVYWRCAKLGDDEINWRESSFQHILDRRGWGQAHIFQFENNSLAQQEFNRAERQIDFSTGSARITNNVIGNSIAFNNEVLLNTSVVEYGLCLSIPSIHLAVFDPITFDAWGTDYGGENPDNFFGNDNNGARNPPCKSRVEYYFIFRQNNPDQMQALADLLLSDIIPDGHIVVLYTARYVSYDSWNLTPDIYDAFEAMDASIIGSEMAQDTVPFSLITRKGDPEFTFELYGESLNDVLNNIVDVPASGNSGLMVSPRIGPASNWGTLSWQTSSLESTPGDTSRVSIVGIKPNGVKEEILESPYDEVANSLSNIGAVISPQEYPYLEFQIFSEDEENQTPRQVDRWHVLYDEVTELAVNPNRFFAFSGNEVAQGAEGFLSVAIENVSMTNSDSLLIRYWVEDSERNEIEIPYSLQDSLLIGEVLIDTVFFDTRFLQGENTLWVEVNPLDTETGMTHQSEQTRFNNILRIPFTVTSDEENPILDVTFDGIHIINGEVVSPNPEVLIALKDENPFLIMDEPADTSLFKVFIAAPGTNLRRVYFTNQLGEEEMQFIPAENEQNRAKIFYRPDLKLNGEYKMLVQASDKSGNSSGNADFEIDFEVVKESTITEVLNYPNPFSTSTQFIFTLTGDEVPDEFKIQIMTISGRVVREIMQDEFGPIRIGRNRSAYRWDARDEYGDRLANGVYLYRVIAKINGEDIMLRDGGGAQYFEQGFGKMVLFR
jgi:hypothetical protein